MGGGPRGKSQAGANNRRADAAPLAGAMDGRFRHAARRQSAGKMTGETKSGHSNFPAAEMLNVLFDLPLTSKILLKGQRGIAGFTHVKA
jgi:hypothetical protein